MATSTAPERKGNAKRHKTITAGWSNNTSLSSGNTGYPAFAPQAVDFHNAGTAEQNAVFTTQAGDSVTVPIAPGQTYPAEGPIDSLQTSGANVSAVAMWYNTSGYPSQ